MNKNVPLSCMPGKCVLTHGVTILTFLMNQYRAVGSDCDDVILILHHLPALFSIHVYVHKRYQHGIEPMLKRSMHMSSYYLFVLSWFQTITAVCFKLCMNFMIVAKPTTGNLIPALTLFNYFTMSRVKHNTHKFNNEFRLCCVYT